ncbi:Conjugal transfer protein [Variovorax sp. OV700]|nr:Conjugal transfer protein [Variovorax sp. OV700]
MKPARVGLKTNLAITTNRRTYLLELSSTPQAWMASVSWDYPKDLMLALQKQAREAQVAAPVDCAKAHFFLAEARHAHELLDGGSTLGKIVLLPRSVKLLR